MSYLCILSLILSCKTKHVAPHYPNKLPIVSKFVGGTFSLFLLKMMNSLSFQICHGSSREQENKVPSCSLWDLSERPMPVEEIFMHFNHSAAGINQKRTAGLADKEFFLGHWIQRRLPRSLDLFAPFSPFLCIRGERKCSGISLPCSHHFQICVFVHL